MLAWGRVPGQPSIIASPQEEFQMGVTGHGQASQTSLARSPDTGPGNRDPATGLNALGAGGVGTDPRFSLHRPQKWYPQKTNKASAHMSQADDQFTPEDV